MYQITFQFENGGKPVIVDATPNTTILDAAKAANVAIDAPCNGNGSCGKRMSDSAFYNRQRNSFFDVCPDVQNFDERFSGGEKEQLDRFQCVFDGRKSPL